MPRLTLKDTLHNRHPECQRRVAPLDTREAGPRQRTLRECVSRLRLRRKHFARGYFAGAQHDGALRTELTINLDNVPSVITRYLLYRGILLPVERGRLHVHQSHCAPLNCPSPLLVIK